jgi:hypothetical protein
LWFLYKALALLAVAVLCSPSCPLPHLLLLTPVLYCPSTGLCLCAISFSAFFIWIWFVRALTVSPA